MPKSIRPPLRERLLRPFEWYGFSRAKIRSEMKVLESTSDAILYDWKGYKIWWPKGADPERLVSMIMEIFVAFNPHCYTPSNSLPWVEGKIVIDVGSCEGLFALRALREFHASQVIAIEPGRFMAGLLKQTFQANGCGERATIVQCLLGKERGCAAFQECLSDPTLASIEELNENNRENLVEIVPLDAIARELHLERVDVIKMDAEGADFDILLGAENIIREWRPQLLVTTYHVTEHASQMRQWIESLDLDYKFVFRGIAAMGTLTARPHLMLAETTKPFKKGLTG
jgi:FkbM family methyltransferase